MSSPLTEALARLESGDQRPGDYITQHEAARAFREVPHGVSSADRKDMSNPNYCECGHRQAMHQDDTEACVACVPVGRSMEFCPCTTWVCPPIDHPTDAQVEAAAKALIGVYWGNDDPDYSTVKDEDRWAARAALIAARMVEGDGDV